jgi:hypothetical protein
MGAHSDSIVLPVPLGTPQVVVENDPSMCGLSAVSILRYMYTTIFLYSYLISYLTGCPWYTMIAYYVLAYVIFYAWHYQCHHLIWWVPFNKSCYQAHKEHHFEVYPPDAFFGRKGEGLPNTPDQTWWEYANPIGWLTQHEALLYGMMLSVVIVSFFCGVQCSTLGGVAFGFFLIGLIGNYLHHAFHIPDIWLLRYKWFSELRALHYVHHLGNAKHNYGILNMSLDRILGSFKFEWSTTKTN